MNRLKDIESAISELPAEEQQELLLFLVARLRAQGGLPGPRTFSSEQMKAWIAEDEADMRRLRDDKAA